MNKPVWLDQGWQPTGIAFIPSAEAWEVAMKQFNSNDPFPIDGMNSFGVTKWLVNDKTGASVILVVMNDAISGDPVEVVSTLVHEAVHVWQFACEHMGEEKPGIEMEAYGIQHITRELIRAYGRTMGKGKKWKIK